MEARQVRASFDGERVRVYQAFSPEIARIAVQLQTFEAPFKRERMTWIKPSFTWMLYRSGWATKIGQERILAVDISRAGFEWALSNSCLSHFDVTVHKSPEAWQALLKSSPVRIQWDPERSVTLDALPWRTIQVGLAGAAVDEYLDDWISSIEDVTPLAKDIETAVKARELDRARSLLPLESAYPLPPGIAERIGCSGHV